MATTTSTSNTAKSQKSWIRGVNIGGWLLMERFITPYMFAITSCHLQGDFCYYPGQISAPPVESSKHSYCDLNHCEAHLIENAMTGDRDFPTDEYTLASSFKNKAIAKEYFSMHWDRFVTKSDVQALSEAGVTHVRVPMPHWIVGEDSILEDEPWIDGQWLYFVRFVGWCREYKIQVWTDIHTAPGSQNGFDNSGQLLEDSPTCVHWSSNEILVQRSLKAVQDIAGAIVQDNLGDVVTGMGVLNEPFADCDVTVVKSFYEEALNSVRNTLGDATAVYIGDMFNATNWNNDWWTDPQDFSNTYLDSHYYHVFAEKARALTPKQHIAYLCRKDTREMESCCYEDHPKNTVPSKGISRLVGEWSASFDTLPVAKTTQIMKAIQKTGEAPEMERVISKERQGFLKHFVEAQIVVYESKSTGVSSGWFYWTLKMEGGAFAEWDFLRGWTEGWIPSFPGIHETSESIYGTCEEIAVKTEDDVKVVHEFPDPDKTKDSVWLGPDIDDDYVVAHASTQGQNSESKRPSKEDETASKSKQSIDANASEAENGESKNKSEAETKQTSVEATQHWSLFPILVLTFFGYGVYTVFFKPDSSRSRVQYRNLDTGSTLRV